MVWIWNLSLNLQTHIPDALSPACGAILKIVALCRGEAWLVKVVYQGQDMKNWLLDPALSISYPLSDEQSQWQAPRVRHLTANATMPSPLWWVVTSEITIQRNLSFFELLLSDSITVMRKLLQRIGIKSRVIDILNLARRLFNLWNWLMGGVWMSLELWFRKAWRCWKLSLMGCSHGNMEEQNTEMWKQDCAYEVLDGYRDSVKSWISSHSSNILAKNLFYLFPEIFVNIRK